MKSVSKTLEKRLADLEELFQHNDITEKDYDVLDTAARVADGALSYEEVYDIIVNGFVD